MQQVFGTENHYIQDEGRGTDIICALRPKNSGENTDPGVPSRHRTKQQKWFKQWWYSRVAIAASLSA